MRKKALGEYNRRKAIINGLPETLPQFAEMFNKIYGNKNYDVPIEILAVHFQEEIGEVCEAINKIYDQTLLGKERQFTHEDLEEEVADVFIWLVAMYWNIDYILGGAKAYFDKERTPKFPTLDEGLEQHIWKVFANKEGTYMVDPGKHQMRPLDFRKKNT